MVFPGEPSHLQLPMQKSQTLSQLKYSKQQQETKPFTFTLMGDPNHWKYLDQWTATEVASWLSAIGLVNCATQVQSHDIAGDVAGDVTFEDAKEMGLREIDAYRLVRALDELQVLVNEVWQRPNQLSDRLKIDSLQYHHEKLKQKKIIESEVRHDSHCFEHGPLPYPRVRCEIKANCTQGKGTAHFAQMKTGEVRHECESFVKDPLQYHRAMCEIEAKNSTEGNVGKAPPSPLLLPIRKRVRFNNEVEHIAI